MGTETARPGAERLEAVVAGRVQGVGFRYFVRQTAGRLGLAGWVRNEPDGSVRVVAEGPPAALAALELALHEGPAGAAVRDVRASRGPATGAFDGFDVERRG
jgi:acylphosphatase